MTNLPPIPESVSVPNRMLFQCRLPPNVAHTWIQLRCLASAGGITPPLRMADLVSITGKSQASLYTHLSMLKAVGELAWHSSGSGVFIITFPSASISGEPVTASQSSPSGSPMQAADRSDPLTPPGEQPNSVNPESTPAVGNQAHSSQAPQLKVPENRSTIPHFENAGAISPPRGSKISGGPPPCFPDSSNRNSTILDSSTRIPDPHKRDPQNLESKNPPSSIKPPALTDSQVLTSSSVESWEIHGESQNHLDQRSNRIPPDRKNINLVGGGGKRECEGERGVRKSFPAIPTAAGDPLPATTTKSYQGASLPGEPSPHAAFQEAPVASEAQQIYASYTGLSLTPAQLNAIGQKVRDLNIWDNTLDHWLWHHWNPKNITGMLELYARGGGSGCFFCTRGLHLKHTRFEPPDPQHPPGEAPHRSSHDT
jgi:hypothetical protein